MSRRTEQRGTETTGPVQLRRGSGACLRRPAEGEPCRAEPRWVTVKRLLLAVRVHAPVPSPRGPRRGSGALPAAVAAPRVSVRDSRCPEGCPAPGARGGDVTLMTSRAGGVRWRPLAARGGPRSPAAARRSHDRAGGRWRSRRAPRPRTRGGRWGRDRVGPGRRVLRGRSAARRDGAHGGRAG